MSWVTTAVLVIEPMVSELLLLALQEGCLSPELELSSGGTWRRKWAFNGDVTDHASDDVFAYAMGGGNKFPEEAVFISGFNCLDPDVLLPWLAGLPWGGSSGLLILTTEQSGVGSIHHFGRGQTPDVEYHEAPEELP
jgi:hypothetical protein